jgi:protoporphyrinogen oxidase
MVKAVAQLIIGGGPAGICAAHLLQDDDYLLLESSRALGGLCSTITWSGCLFDLGGHVLTTKHADVLEFLSAQVELYVQTRQAFVAHRGEIIGYPFQKNFTDLTDRSVVERCSRSEGQGDYPSPRNFREYLITTLGQGIHDVFAGPYNEKLWGAPLSRMSPHWGDERVAPRSGSAGPGASLDRNPLTAATQVAYPTTGGFSTIFEALARPLRNVLLGSGVRAIDLKRKRVETTSGEVCVYDRLISTMPLDSFLTVTAGLSDEARLVGSELESVGLRLVLLKHRGQLPLGKHRLYTPDADIPSHKIVFQNTSSPLLARKEHHGIMAEVSQASQAHLSDRELVTGTVRGLVSLGVLESAEDIIDATVLSIPRAYPVQTLGKKHALAQLRAELSPQGVELLGRFAEWDYINADQVVKRALLLAEQRSGRLSRAAGA